MLAIIVAAALTPDAPRVDIPPPLAGLSLPLRQALTLQQQGATRLLWVGDPREAEPLAEDARLTLPVEVVPAPAGRVDMAAVCAQVDGPFLLLDVRWLLAPRHYRTLLSSVPEGAAAPATSALRRSARAILDGHFVHAVVGDRALLAALAKTPRDWRQLGVWAQLTAFALTGGWAAAADSEAGRRRAFSAAV